MSSEKLDSYFNTPIKSELEAIKKSVLQKIKNESFSGETEGEPIISS